MAAYALSVSPVHQQPWHRLWNICQPCFKEDTRHLPFQCKGMESNACSCGNIQHSSGCARLFSLNYHMEKKPFGATRMLVMAGVWGGGGCVGGRGGLSYAYNGWMMRFNGCGGIQYVPPCVQCKLLWILNVIWLWQFFVDMVLHRFVKNIRSYKTDEEYQEIFARCKISSAKSCGINVFLIICSAVWFVVLSLGILKFALI